MGVVYVPKMKEYLSQVVKAISNKEVLIIITKQERGIELNAVNGTCSITETLNETTGDVACTFKNTVQDETLNAYNTCNSFLGQYSDKAWRRRGLACQHLNLIVIAEAVSMLIISLLRYSQPTEYIELKTRLDDNNKVSYTVALKTSDKQTIVTTHLGRWYTLESIGKYKNPTTGVSRIVNHVTNKAYKVGWFTLLPNTLCSLFSTLDSGVEVVNMLKLWQATNKRCNVEMVHKELVGTQKV